jgi:glycosyltransferase involved in cell wall biosynthesis
VDVFVDQLGERLAQRGHRVVMFSYTPPGPSRSYEHRTLTPPSTARSRLRRMLVAPLRLNWLDTSGLDVLHLAGDDWFYVRRRVATVRTLYGSAYYEARYATRARRRVSQYVTYGLEVLADRLATASYGINPAPGPGAGRTGYLRLAVELPPAQDVERHGSPLVLFVGTWNGRKRGQLLHETFRREILPKVPEARLVMVSDHCEPGPGVEWVAHPTDEELADLYRAAWVFCLPSTYEGFGLPYIEAMAQGTPVVATSNPGSRFILDGGRCGILTDEHGLGRDIATLLLDRDARSALAQRGLERVADFGWREVLDAHERAYREAIRARVSA